MSTVNVSVPATTANLGPGFDCIGAALTCYNQFQFALTEDTLNPLKITVTGAESHRVSIDQTNLIYQAFVNFYQHLDKSPPSIAINIELGIPLSRGLGSSATAIVGGLVGANELAGQALSIEEVMELAIAIEGHPDNVVPALLGHCQLSVGERGNWQICQVPWHQDLIPVVGIPNFELSTQEARGVLPKQLSRADAIFNIAHMGLLIRALETANTDWLAMALEDKLHQPYRQSLIPGYEAVKQAAIAAGAYGMVISGAGPTLLAITSPKQATEVIKGMETAWQSLDIIAQVRSLSLDTQGARIFY
ncbi:homoserine kinase [Aphanothece sacrum]|uniref:Homoserine kinase n=1 Tax=Aphanothece sacrum FPU1 TaxID=1920663 RepID=A0A401IEA3_APHSA|nr:homoserine kinase [Aphanothece sacrum]GBF79539.1 homoserine kinase [Aphanothece sacrum FPU1]GBF83921.1 homoserine kinase ThrB [Aphanothece sacrum FPU3]